MSTHSGALQDISDTQYTSYMVGYRMYIRILLREVTICTIYRDDRLFHQEQLEVWAEITKRQLLQVGFDPTEGRLTQLLSETSDFRLTRHAVRQLLTHTDQTAAVGLIELLSREARLMWDYMIDLRNLIVTEPTSTSPRDN
jgi:hypothetical protein